MNTTQDLPTSVCPVCRYEMDCTTHIGTKPAEPSAGDFSVCLNCGEMLQFNDILVLKPFPAKALNGLSAKNTHWLIRASRVIRERGRFKP